MVKNFNIAKFEAKDYHSGSVTSYLPVREWKATTRAVDQNAGRSGTGNQTPRMLAGFRWVGAYA